jgi:signal transduction histidine kinase
MLNRLTKALHSIHTRLLLVILLAGLAIHLLVLLALLAHRSMTADAFRRGLAEYVHYLAKDIGSPPDQQRAAEIAKRTGMDIYFLSPDGSWSTSGASLPAPLDRLHTTYDDGSVQIGFLRGHHYLIYREGERERLLFETIRTPAGGYRFYRVGMLLVALVSLLLTVAYYWIRHIMAPLRQLSQGVQELSLGHLDHRVPVKCGDELGDLAQAFNTMAGRLQQLLRIKEQMLRDVSHELRSPLTRMKVALEMAPEGDLKESLHEDVLDMERMVAAILESARMQSGTVPLRLEPCDLVPVLREVVKSREQQPLGVLLEHLPESARLVMDPEKVKSALRNVIDNAVKYSRPDSEPVTVRLIERPGHLGVEVEDRGIGIPEEALPFIFEPFYRVDQSRSRESGGFGLGMSLCKAIMDAHGGSISVESTLGEGTKVVLMFPKELPAPGST